MPNFIFIVKKINKINQLQKTLELTIFLIGSSLSDTPSYFVYALLDPSKGNKPFYIGKGSGNRIKDHYFDHALKNKNRKNNTIKSYRSKGFRDCYEIVKSDLTKDEAFNLEKELITKYGRLVDGSGFLTNVLPGGEDPPTFYGKDHRYFGINPWLTTSAQSKTKNFWKISDIIYIVYIENTKVGKRKLRYKVEKRLNILLTERFSATILDRLRTGWVPNEDSEWLLFKGNYEFDSKDFVEFTEYKVRQFKK